MEASPDASKGARTNDSCSDDDNEPDETTLGLRLCKVAVGANRLTQATTMAMLLMVSFATRRHVPRTGNLITHGLASTLQMWSLHVMAQAQEALAGVLFDTGEFRSAPSRGLGARGR